MADTFLRLIGGNRRLSPCCISSLCYLHTSNISYLFDWIDFQSGIFAFTDRFFRVHFVVDTRNDLLTCKHRQRVSTLKKCLSPAIKTRRRIHGSFGLLGVPKPRYLGKPQTPF